jgi:hypothetical protein
MRKVLRVADSSSSKGSDISGQFGHSEQYGSALSCSRCGVYLQFIGTKTFQEGSRGFDWLGPPFVGLLDRPLNLDVYFCPRCGRLEMFLDGMGEEFRLG